MPINSQTFEGILQQPITTLFFSRSTDHTMNIEEEERVEFVDLTFNSDEEKVEDHAIMSEKQYKILNLKLNAI